MADATVWKLPEFFVRAITDRRGRVTGYAVYQWRSPSKPRPVRVRAYRCDIATPVYRTLARANALRDDLNKLVGLLPKNRP